MDENRKTALLILRDVEEKKAFSDITVNNLIARRNPDSPSFVRELAYGVVRRKIYLDYLIRALLTRPGSRISALERTLLRMGLYQILYMDAVPDYAAVSETLALGARLDKSRRAFVNAVLRTFLRKQAAGEEIALPDREQDLTAYLSVRYSYAPWIVEDLLADYGREEAEEILAAGNEMPRVTLRANRLKVKSPEQLAQQLGAAGYAARCDGRYPALIHIEGQRIPMGSLYEEGLYSIQGAASYRAALAVDPQPGEQVVDVCAAPGGKAMAMAEAMEDRGHIIATDLYEKRLAAVEAQAKRLGVRIVKTRAQDASAVDETLVGKADRVLADVPCSGLGTVRKKPDIKYHERDRELETLPEKQLSILSASSAYVKAGGVLVYATCTILSRENQKVVSRFVRRHPDFEKTEETLLLPHRDGTDGFYFCKLTRAGAGAGQEAVC
jgi:16S rRNA (cytosine967-C5)-methyltransferase